MAQSGIRSPFPPCFPCRAQTEALPLTPARCWINIAINAGVKVLLHLYLSWGHHPSVLPYSCQRTFAPGAPKKENSKNLVHSSQCRFTDLSTCQLYRKLAILLLKIQHKMLTSNSALAKYRNFSISSPCSRDKGVTVSLVLSISVLLMEFFFIKQEKINIQFGSLLRGSCKSCLILLSKCLLQCYIVLSSLLKFN